MFCIANRELKLENVGKARNATEKASLFHKFIATWAATVYQ